MEDKDDVQSSYTQAVGANNFHQAKHLLTRQYLAFQKAFPEKCYCPVNNHKEPKYRGRRSPFVCCKAGSFQNI